MIGFVARRLAVGVFVMWGAATLMFVLLRAAPGDPATLLLGSDASPEDIRALSARLGLDGSLLTQYGTYLGQAVGFEFGSSFRYSAPAMDVVLGRLLPTVELTLTSAVIAVTAGLALGVTAGRTPGGVVDRVVSALTITLQGMPTFWVGIMLILVFAATLSLLPSSGVGSPLHIVMPAVTLALPFTAIVARISRAALAETMAEQHITTARSKGLTEGQVVRAHALPNSLAPVVTVVGLQLGALLGGAVVVENVFAWPGLGTLLVESVSFRDYAVVQSAVLLIAAIVVVLNLLADLAYALLDPRLRTGRPA